MVTQTTGRKVQLSATVSPELKALAEEIAKENNTTKSGIVSQCLEELARKRTIELMEEGYKAMAKENKDFAKMTFELQGQVVLGKE
ncbi:MAG: hypothetical protein KAI42_04870 [Dehalococcoidales bacterium]|nr:hypothetical protein [Dehalococcoidales bacterium]